MLLLALFFNDDILNHRGFPRPLKGPDQGLGLLVVNI